MSNNQQEMVALVTRLHNEGLSWAAVGERIGRHPEYARGLYRRSVQKQKFPASAPVKEKKEIHEPSPTERFTSRRREMSLEGRVRELTEELKSAAVDANVAELFKQVAHDTAPTLPPAPPIWQFETGDDSIVETVCQMMSDWHAYEEVKAARTRGFAEYNPEVMNRRLGNLVAAHGSIVDRMQSSGRYVFPELFIPLLGDFCPGTIHKLEQHAHGYSVVSSSYNTAWVLSQVIREMSRFYPETYVAGVVGNHGRMMDDKKMPSKDPTRNWDYFIYMLVYEMCREIPNIHFWFPDAYSAQVEVRGWNFLLNHGYTIKRWMGIPWYGMERWATKSTALEAQRENIIHYRLLGQFHKSAQLPSQVGETFVNGSVIGANEYAVDEVTESDPPKQLLFGIHAEHGVTHRWPINLLGARKNAPIFSVNHLDRLQDASGKATMGSAPVWKIQGGS